ncbi:MAG TPA: tetratricopeptide repeat protein [Candidatus Limnocylindrales bacterium]|nr:tetratricopeptide repeat protein [Candidatus Limnocylindrales bacterium]
MFTRPPGSSPFRLLVCLALFAIASPSGTAAKDSWIEVDSPHFKIISNAGEGQARKLADQFEQFRELFHTSFPKFRVDLGKPLVIFAVKNEDTLKLLLPAFWEVKGRLHPAGIFMPGEARDFVVVRTDVETDNPYEVVYHEYTHAIMNLNVQGLPIWLGEGLAEFFGNSTIHEKDVEIGKIPHSRLEVLQTNRLIPIDALMQAGADSPYYNEQNRASVFYAESWAIVHYLQMDPEARKRHLLSTFLTAWDASGNQLEAATKTFGDLKKFSSAMEAYARQQTFYVGRVTTSIHGNAKSYSSRALSPGEVAAEQALFYLQTQRLKEARASTDEALQVAPKLALAHEAAGLIAYQQRDYPDAEKEFARAIELSPTSYVSYFFAAQARLRGGRTEFEELPEITRYLEKAMELNPQFAPAYATLANFYAMRTETRDNALAMAKKAIDLEPGNLNYTTSYGFVLLNMGNLQAAKALSARIKAAARTPQEEHLAAEFASAVASRENFPQANSYQTRSPASSQSNGDTKSIEVQETPAAPPAVTSPGVAPASPSTSNAPRHFMLGPEYHLEGKIVAVKCTAAGEVNLTLSVNSVLMKFRNADLKTVEVTSASKPPTASQLPCALWKGQRAKVAFHSLPAGEFDGELSALYFF